LKGIHRIGITDEDGDVVGIVSQWTIANYLATVPTDDKEWIPSLRGIRITSKVLIKFRTYLQNKLYKRCYLL
jgi:hypothetical protein